MLELEIEALIETRLGIRNADVRCIDTAPLRVQGRVLLDGVLLYARDHRFRVHYETQTRKQYFDFQPVLAMMRQARTARRMSTVSHGGLHG